uniref:Putative RNA ligase n=1 Tax=viral metagenome TaxID=1070528 RepID=A0A6H1ZD39_9ZZZZ
MKEYHKIQTVYKRDPENHYKTLLIGEFSLLEFEYLRNNQWIFTEKVNGTNIRIMFNGGEITFGGKTDNAQIPAFLVKKLQERFLNQSDKFIEKFGLDPIEVCLYSEGYGAKIQKGGGNYRQDQDIVLFDVKIDKWWLQREDVEDIAKFFNLDIVPIIGEGTLEEMVEKVKCGFNSIWGDFTAEGIVARPKIELKSRNGLRIITKIKYKDFYYKE